MSTISVYFKNRVTFDSKDPELVRFLQDHGYSLDEFLADDMIIIDYLNVSAELITSVEVRA